jgi:hypothetical protein
MIELPHRQPGVDHALLSFAGFYPPGAVIKRETRPNEAAVIYIPAVADNPAKWVNGMCIYRS